MVDKTSQETASRHDTVFPEPYLSAVFSTVAVFAEGNAKAESENLKLQKEYVKALISAMG